MPENPFLEKRLEELKEEYSKTKDNKATNKYVGGLRAKMARIKKELATKSGKKGAGFSVRKSGDATIALVGFPNAGKSSLLKRLTGVESKVADYAFTTLEVIPGMLEYKGAKIQVLDLPGLIQDAHIGKGGGTKVASVIRIADLLLFVADINNIEQLFRLLDELDMLGIRVNRSRPRIKVERRETGGIVIETNRRKTPDKKELISVLNGIGMYNVEIMFYQDSDMDTFLEALDESLVYKKGILALNKIDTMESKAIEEIRNKVERSRNIKVVAVSATQNKNVEGLKDSIFDELDLIKVYLKPKNGEPDLSKPMIVKKGDTVMDIARKIHSKAAKNLKYANVTGDSVKFLNQRVGGDHALSDGDIVTLVYDKA